MSDIWIGYSNFYIYKETTVYNYDLNDKPKVNNKNSNMIVMVTKIMIKKQVNKTKELIKTTITGSSYFPLTAQ